MSRTDRRHPLQRPAVWIIASGAVVLTVAWRFHWIPFPGSTTARRPRATDLDPNLPAPPNDFESVRFAQGDPEAPGSGYLPSRLASGSGGTVPIQQSEPEFEPSDEGVAPVSFSPGDLRDKPKRPRSYPGTDDAAITPEDDPPADDPPQPMSQKRSSLKEQFRDAAVQPPEGSDSEESWPPGLKPTPIRAVSAERPATSNGRIPRPRPLDSDNNPFGVTSGFEAAPDSRRPARDSTDTVNPAVRGRVEQASTEQINSPDGRVQPAGGQKAAKTVEKQEPARATSKVSENAAIERLLQSEDPDDEIEAHFQLSTEYWQHPESREKLLPTLEQLSDKIYFHKTPHYLEPYVVAPGENLQGIAKKHDVSWQYLAKLNLIEPKKLRAGQKIKVMNGPFAVVVDLSRFELTVHTQGHFVARFPIGIGKDNKTPQGKFTVLDKLEDPTYYGPDGIVAHDDPKNPLGERWIDLGNSIGIHGTIDPDSIGKAQSRGCIRLVNADVEDLYDLLTVGSEVVIRK